MKQYLTRFKLNISPLCFQFLSISICLGTLAGCASAPERHAVPEEMTNTASIPGIPDARFWGDEWPKFSREIFTNSSETFLKEHYSAIFGKPHNYLAISGGGANGAFGAGLLSGWTKNGTRPEFTMVTGVSTGALSAPFAFLGPDYDDELKKVYTSTRTEDIVKERGYLDIIFNDAMADTEPLKTLIAKYITAEIIKAIAAEHRRGRRLFVGTVNLDASRPVIWNIGAIANSSHPDKIPLIHEILRASSAIPVAFPPVVIPVEADGQTYDEMHVDGGTGTQVFIYPASLDWQQIADKLEVPGPANVYVIRNSILEPNYQGIRRTIFPIANRTIASLIRTQGIGDLYQIYALGKRDGTEYNLAFIPSSFDDKPNESFDPVYMEKLFNLGEQMAQDGYPWEKAPPGYLLE